MSFYFTNTKQKLKIKKKHLKLLALKSLKVSKDYVLKNLIILLNK